MKPAPRKRAPALVFTALFAALAAALITLALRERPEGRYSSSILPDWTVSVGSHGDYEIGWNGIDHTLSKWNPVTNSPTGITGDAVDTIARDVSRFSTSTRWVAIEFARGALMLVDTRSDSTFGPFESTDFPLDDIPVDAHTRDTLIATLQRPRRSRRVPLTYMAAFCATLAAVALGRWVYQRND